jgi:hypothetical protein
MTPVQYKTFLAGIKKPSKYGNKTCIVNGEKIHSIGEGNRYSVLLILQKAGKIRNLRRQTRWLIADEVTWNGKKLRPKYFTDDFNYTDCETEEFIVEDYKGAKTPLYLLKRQLFLCRYPEIVFKES